MKSTTILCPCHSGIIYETCCKPLHDGKKAENALQLMRSRYSAYALHLAKYIILTTHPKNPHFIKETLSLEKNILQFSKSTLFKGLKIIEFNENENRATVTFTAYLTTKEGNADTTFTEKSYFEKINNEWLYKSGEITYTKG